MTKPKEIPLFPVASIAVGPLMQHDAITLRLDFLTGPMQPVDQANIGRHYLLTPQQAQYLAQQMLSSLAQLQNHGFQATPDQQH